jgi:hypothetical protein
MKKRIPALIIALTTVCLPMASAEDSCMKCCEMMKTNQTTAPAASNKVEDDLKEGTTELSKLVTEMNGSIGKEKIEAMAAAITRLAEQYKALSERIGTQHAAPAKVEAHQHGAE